MPTDTYPAMNLYLIDDQYVVARSIEDALALWRGWVKEDDPLQALDGPEQISWIDANVLLPAEEPEVGWSMPVGPPSEEIGDACCKLIAELMDRECIKRSGLTIAQLTEAMEVARKATTERRERDMDIEHRFKHHPPLRDEEARFHQSIRIVIEDAAHRINAMLPSGREKSLALTKLEEAMFWSNASYARWRAAHPEPVDPPEEP